MAWLGSTIKSLDTRKELVNYIVSNTITSRAVVTNTAGEIDSSVVTVAELALLSGISSNVQMQLSGLEDDKQDEITGAATTVTSNNLTSNRVLMSNASGKIKVSSMSSTTFDYLDMTSSVQDQLNGKHPAITVSAPLSQSRVDGLASTLSGKQPLIGSSTNLVLNKNTFGAGVDSIEFQGDLSGLVSQLQGGKNCFTLQGKKISLYTDPEWRSSAENVGKRWITVTTDEEQYKLGRGRARYTEFRYSLVARLSSWKSHPHTNVPYEDSNGLVFYKHIRAKEEITADMRCEVFDSFLAAKWTICADCDTGTTEGETIGKVCSKCYVSNCIGNAIKRRRIAD